MDESLRLSSPGPSDHGGPGAPLEPVQASAGLPRLHVQGLVLPAGPYETREKGEGEAMIGLWGGVLLYGLIGLGTIHAARAWDWWRRRNAPLWTYLWGDAYSFPDGAYHRALPRELGWVTRAPRARRWNPYVGRSHGHGRPTLLEWIAQLRHIRALEVPMTDDPREDARMVELGTLRQLPGGGWALEVDGVEVGRRVSKRIKYATEGPNRNSNEA